MISKYFIIGISHGINQYALEVCVSVSARMVPRCRESRVLASVYLYYHYQHTLPIDIRKCSVGSNRHLEDRYISLVVCTWDFLSREVGDVVFAGYFFD